MQTANVEIGKIYHFGWKKTPNKVIKVGAPYPNGNVPVTLKGPRGGEFQATVFVDGRCRKH